MPVTEPDDQGSTVRDIGWKKSRYRIDLMEHLRGFGPDRRLNYLFGDVNWIPEVPTIVKSRPIAPDNGNAVILKLDKFRHFETFRDPTPFREKLPMAVWRGRINSNPMRSALVERIHGNSAHDIGQTGEALPGLPPKAFLSPQSQMKYRYIISIEGIDVATGLKWILASNSLCIGPPMRFETWFMEGLLKPGIHYVAVKPDFSDLEEKIAYYEARPEEAEHIVENAHAHWAQFTDEKTEKLISMLVLQKFFERTGQLPDDTFPHSFFGGTA
jgi:hypothetical protein